MICFQFWILRSLITTKSLKLIYWRSCDLLSILDITIFDYNGSEADLKKLGVVICFQFWILRSLITTNSLNIFWIKGCDLLSILDITIFDYNIWETIVKKDLVVICFQFWILRSLITTPVIKYRPSTLLWFAFNSGYYDLWLQPKKQKYARSTVVICFQFWILRSLITTFCRMERWYY